MSQCLSAVDWFQETSLSLSICSFVVMCACLLKKRVTHVVHVSVYEALKSEHHAVPGFPNIIFLCSESFIQANPVISVTEYFGHQINLLCCDLFVSK